MRVLDLGLIAYRDAWKIQEEIHAQAADGAEETLLLLEHTPVITFGRRVADAQKHLLAGADLLRQMGVDVVESDRGGDITFHGPGQLVAYPIVRLNDHALSVGGYVRRLEESVIQTLGDFGIRAYKDACAIGVWVDLPTGDKQRADNPTPPDSACNIRNTRSAKICALGVRIKRGTSLHGIALNLSTNLSYFNLINACGLGRPVTSIQQILGERSPKMSAVKETLASRMRHAFG